MSKEFKIKETAEEQGLGEIYQSSGIQEAILRQTDKPDVLEKVTSFVKCRDFLVDSYSCHQAKKNFSIYGFEFKAETEALDYDAVRLLVKFSSTTERKNFDTNVRYLHDIERRNKFTPTEVCKCNMKNCVVLIADKRWLQNCLLYSFYTLMPRLAGYAVSASVTNLRQWLDELAQQDTSDGAYVKSISAKTWDVITSNLKILETDKFCGFDPKKDSVVTVHHNSGFISVLGSHTEINENQVRKNEHWKIMVERGLDTHVKPKKEKQAA
jgi:hypothetical protein